MTQRTDINDRYNRQIISIHQLATSRGGQVVPSFVCKPADHVAFPVIVLLAFWNFGCVWLNHRTEAYVCAEQNEDNEAEKCDSALCS